MTQMSKICQQIYLQEQHKARQRQQEEETVNPVQLKTNIHIYIHKVVPEKVE